MHCMLEVCQIEQLGNVKLVAWWQPLAGREWTSLAALPKSI